MIDLFRKVVKNCHITAVKVLFTVEDITESVKERIRQEKERERVQKVLEESQAAVEAANKAKTDFLFNMSHDIHTYECDHWVFRVDGKIFWRYRKVPGLFGKNQKIEWIFAFSY